MEFESRLQELAEQRQSLEDLSNNGLENGDSAWDELRAQAGACPHCRQLWNEFALLDRVMPGIRTLVPHVDLVDAVIDSWRQDLPDKVSPTTKSKSAPAHQAATRNWIPLLVVAAASILISFPLLFPDSASEDLPTTFEVAVSPEDDIPDSPATNETAATATSSGEVDWHILAEDAGSAYWALASETADAFASVSLLAPRLRNRSPAESPLTTRRAEERPPGLGVDLKPIKEDVGRAVGFLLDVLPGSTL